MLFRLGILMLLAVSEPAHAMDISDGELSKNIEDRRGLAKPDPEASPDFLEKRSQELFRNSKDLIVAAEMAKKNIPFPLCIGGPTSNLLRKKLETLRIGLTEREAMLDIFANRSWKNEFLYDAREISSQIDSCKESFQALSQNLSEKKSKLKILRDELDRSVAPEVRVNALEVSRISSNLKAACSRRSNDQKIADMETMITNSSRSLVYNFGAIRRYLNNRINGIEAFEEQIKNKSKDCESLTGG